MGLAAAQSKNPGRAAKLFGWPDMPPGWDWIWEAWIDLSSCRMVGFGVGPIPWTAMKAWADDKNLNCIERQDLYHLIPSADAIFLAERAKND